MKYDFNEQINRFQTASDKWDSLEEQFGVKEAIPMWIADMDFKSPPCVINAIKQKADEGVFGYSIRPESYFQAIVEWLAKRHNWLIDKEWVTHSPGVVPALGAMITTFSDPGDKIIIQSPVYHHFERVISAHNREVVCNPLQSEDGYYTMDFEQLEKIMDEKVKILILCSPHNPVGRVWKKEELQKIGEICIKNNVLIIADEIHFDLIYKPHNHIPFASISKEFANHSITCISPGKTFNLLGMPTSSIIIPNRLLREQYNQKMMDLSIGSPNIFGMVALESAYQDGEEWLDELLNYLQENRDYLVQYIKNHLPQIKVVEPEGTFLAWLDCRGLGLSVEELDQFMLHKAKLALNNGAIFGVEGEGFVRLNFGCSRLLLEKALKQLTEAIQTLSIKENAVQI